MCHIIFPHHRLVDMRYMTCIDHFAWTYAGELEVKPDRSMCELAYLCNSP